MTPGFLDLLRPRRAPPPGPVIDGLSQLRAYWESLRRDGALPARAAIDPRGLGGILDRVFLAERIGRGLARLRIAGSGLADFAGTELRGLPLSCLFAASSRPQLGVLVERACTDPAVVEMDLGLDRAMSGGLAARLLLLPLADDAPNRPLLGAIGFAGARPASGKLQLRSWRDETLSVAPAEPARVPAQPIRRIGHLALVHVND